MTGVFLAQVVTRGGHRGFLGTCCNQGVVTGVFLAQVVTRGGHRGFLGTGCNQGFLGTGCNPEWSHGIPWHRL